MSKKTSIPPYDEFMNPLIQALKALGGSGTIEEIDAKVIEIVDLSDDLLEVIHDPKRGSTTEVEYRIAWARTYLKKYGVLDNSSRGIWSLTAKGREIDSVNPQAVKRFIRLEQQKKPSPSEEQEYPAQAIEIDTSSSSPMESDLEIASSWNEQVMELLLDMDPAAFERLIQRLLRESGFIQVEVTGRSGDGGIDGKGIMRLAGLLSFHVVFQCKRYRGSVGSAQVRDFRGAMVGRADKGLLITTGNFTKDAIREATRDGAPPIDLVDGDQLVEKLRELSLGIHTKRIEVEKIVVDPAWFKSI
jgi:restriction system protein